MHVDSLEHRKLFAATSTLTDGIVRVVGTDESEKIEVRHLVSFTVGDAATGGSAKPVTNDIQVLVNGEELARYAGADVKRVNVFGLGGRDQIVGAPASGGLVRVNYVTGKTGATPQPLDLTAGAPPFRMYVEGGSGNDRIVGGGGNDWLHGGRGNDVIVDSHGRNLIDGGAGDDSLDGNDRSSLTRFVRGGNSDGGTVVWTAAPGETIVIDSATARDRYSGDMIVVNRGNESVVRWTAQPASSFRSTPDTVIGGDGNDTAIVNADDEVTTVETKQQAFTPTTIDSIANAMKVPASFRVGSVIHTPEGTALLNQSGTLLFFDGKIFDARSLRENDGGTRVAGMLKLVKSGEGVSLEGEYSAGSILVSEIGVVVLSNDGTKLQYKGKTYDATGLRGEDGALQLGDLLDLIEGRSPTRGS